MSSGKRRLLLALILLAWAWPAQAQVAFGGQAVNQDNAVSSLQVTLNGVQSGDLVAACVSFRQGGSAITISGVADGSNGAWSHAVTRSDDADNPGASIWYVPNSASGNLTITVTLSASSSSLYLNAAHFSGVATVNPVEDTNSESNSGTAFSHGEITTTSGGAIVTCGAINGYGKTKTAATDFTLLTQIDPEDRHFGQYRVTTGGVTTTATATLSASDGGRGVIAGFSAASGGGDPPVVKRLLLMGVGGW